MREHGGSPWLGAGGWRSGEYACPGTGGSLQRSTPAARSGLLASPRKTSFEARHDPARQFPNSACASRCWPAADAPCRRRSRRSRKCPRRSRMPPPQRGPDGSWPALDWYRGFGSRDLDTLIAQPRASSNLDLAAAQARLVQADARARQAGRPLLPGVDANGNGNSWPGIRAAAAPTNSTGRRCCPPATKSILGQEPRDRQCRAVPRRRGAADGTPWR